MINCHSDAALYRNVKTFQFGNTINWVINHYYFRISNLCGNCLYYTYSGRHCSWSLTLEWVGITVFVKVVRFLPPSISARLSDYKGILPSLLGIFLQSGQVASWDSARNGPIYQIGLSVNESSATGWYFVVRHDWNRYRPIDFLSLRKKRCSFCPNVYLSQSWLNIWHELYQSNLLCTQNWISLAIRKHNKMESAK